MNFQVNNNLTEIIVYKYEIYQIKLNNHINLVILNGSYKIIYILK